MFHFIAKCINPEKEMRPNFDEIVEDELFSDINNTKSQINKPIKEVVLDAKN